MTTLAPERTTSRTDVLLGWPRLAVPATVAALAALLVTSRSFFYSDDFLYGYLFGQELDLNGATLVRSYFGHLVPGFAALDWTIYRTFGLHWGVTSAVTVLGFAGLALATQRLVETVLGRSRGALAAGLLVALSPTLLPLASWWGAVATNVLPLALGVAFLGSAARWMRNRRAGHLVSAVVTYTLALSLFEKALLLSVACFGWGLLVADAGTHWPSRVRSAVHRWPLWLAVAVPSAVVTGMYVLGPYRAESGEAAAPVDLAVFGARAVGLGLTPSVFGIDLQTAPWRSLSRVLAVASLALLLLLVVWTCRRARLCVHIWAWAFVLVGLYQLPTAVGRAAIAGPDGGRVLRYQMESATFVLVAACIAVTLALRASRTDDPKSRTAVGVGVGLVLVLSLVTAASVVRSSPGVAARAWLGQASDSWPSQGVRVVDTAMPDTFLYDWQYPYNMASYALPQLRPGTTVTTDLRDSVTVGSRGFGPARFEPLHEPVPGGCSTAGVLRVPVDLTDDHVDDVRVIVAGEPGTPLTVLGELDGAQVGLAGYPQAFAVDDAGTADLVAHRRPGTVADTLLVQAAADFCVESVTPGRVVADVD